MPDQKKKPAMHGADLGNHLFRWQYGHECGAEGDADRLPNRPMRIPDALRGMATAYRGWPDGPLPTALVLARVLEYLADRLEGCATCGAPPPETRDPALMEADWLCRKCIARVKEWPDE